MKIPGNAVRIPRNAARIPRNAARIPRNAVRIPRNGVKIPWNVLKIPRNAALQCMLMSRCQRGLFVQTGFGISVRQIRVTEPMEYNSRTLGLCQGGKDYKIPILLYILL